MPRKPSLRNLTERLNNAEPIVWDTPAGDESPETACVLYDRHHWVAVGAKPEGWLFWVAQSCECGETRQVRTPR